MVVKPTIIMLLQNFAKDVISEGVHLKKMILFGSYANNTQRRNSDIDVALISDDFNGFVFQDLDLFIKSKTKKSYAKIQIQTFPASYFLQGKGDPFVDEIKRTGVEIKF